MTPHDNPDHGKKMYTAKAMTPQRPVPMLPPVYPVGSIGEATPAMTQAF